ncbi:MAG: rhomboid family intramembrane serine protease [Candidatus Diapherotrites archaeon]|nr:rhomboid family intramembrane serine protease [Candidatus Diapherotrites archaeon]
MMKARATLTITISLIVAYFLMSKGQLYVYPISQMYLFGVSRNNLIGALTYSFMHIGIKHLLANLLVLVPVGLIAENRFGWKDTLGVFLFSGTVAGFCYALLSPGTWVIGSSAGIAGLLVAGYMADIKKTVIVIIACVVFASFIAIPATQAVISYIETAHEKVINEKVSEIQQLNTSLRELQEKINEKKAKGENITPEIVIVQNLTQKLNETVKVKEVKEQQKQTIERGSKEEAATPPSMLIHLFGALAGLLYVYEFRVEAFEWLIDDLKGMWGRIRGKNHVRHKH